MLTLIKVVHSVVWAVFVGCILGISVLHNKAIVGAIYLAGIVSTMATWLR